MNGFTLHLGGIERREYYEACGETARRVYGILAGGMVLLCGAILILKRHIGPADILGPVGVYLVVVCLYALATRLNYKDQLAVIDPPVVYTFDAGGWTVRAEGGQAAFSWPETVRLKRTRRCLFLYNDGASGNLLPLRLLTDEQAAAIEGWYAASRAEAKTLRREREKQEREAYRASHSFLRFGRTGPAWGPWKRKK